MICSLATLGELNTLNSLGLAQFNYYRPQLSCGKEMFYTCLPVHGGVRKSVCVCVCVCWGISKTGCL